MAKLKSLKNKPYIVGGIFTILYVLVLVARSILFSVLYINFESINVSGAIYSILSNLFTSFSSIQILLLVSICAIAVLMFTKKARLAFVPISLIIITIIYWLISDTIWAIDSAISFFSSSVDLSVNRIILVIYETVFCIMDSFDLIALSLLLVTAIGLAGKSAKIKTSKLFVFSTVLAFSNVLLFAFNDFVYELYEMGYIVNFSTHLDYSVKDIISLCANVITYFSFALVVLFVGLWMSKSAKIRNASNNPESLVSEVYETSENEEVE